MSETSRTTGFALVLLSVVAVIQLLGVALASAGLAEVAHASPFGRTGTVVASAFIAVVALAGVVVAWRGAPGAARMITAVALFIAVGILAMMALFFMISGGLGLIFAILLVLAAAMLGMIGRAVLQSPLKTGR